MRHSLRPLPAPPRPSDVHGRRSQRWQMRSIIVMTFVVLAVAGAFAFSFSVVSSHLQGAVSTKAHTTTLPMPFRRVEPSDPALLSGDSPATNDCSARLAASSKEVGRLQGVVAQLERALRTQVRNASPNTNDGGAESSVRQSISESGRTSCSLSSISQGRWRGDTFLPSCVPLSPYSEGQTVDLLSCWTSSLSDSGSLPRNMDGPRTNAGARGIRAVLIGDSQMAHTAREWARVLKASPSVGQCRTVRRGSKCGEETTYFNFTPSQTLVPNCKRCAGCPSELVRCAHDVELEYISLPQLLDADMPSREYNTSQESVLFLYLAKQPRPPDLVILSAGLHESAYLWPQAREWWKSQTIWYFQTLRRLFPNCVVVWMHTTFQKDSSLDERVVRILRPISARVALQNGVSVFDAYNVSRARPDLYTDDIHLWGNDRLYYRTILNLFVRWWCQPGRDL